jgi:putative tricarboxylic transport membrane protein
MQRAEQFICFIWIGLAIWVCGGSLRLETGTFSDPGSGFLPFGTGALLGILAIAHFLNITFRYPEKRAAGLPWKDVHWENGVYVIIALLAYVFLLPRLGYLLDTFLLMFFLFRVLERKKWWTVLIGTTLVIGATYLIFGVWLMVQFPKGFLGVG